MLDIILEADETTRQTRLGHLRHLARISRYSIRAYYEIAANTTRVRRNDVSWLTRVTRSVAGAFCRARAYYTSSVSDKALRKRFQTRSRLYRGEEGGGGIRPIKNSASDVCAREAEDGRHGNYHRAFASSRGKKLGSKLEI